MIGPGGIDLMKTRSGGMPPTGHYMDKLTQVIERKRAQAKQSRELVGNEGKEVEALMGVVEKGHEGEEEGKLVLSKCCAFTNLYVLFLQSFAIEVNLLV